MKHISRILLFLVWANTQSYAQQRLDSGWVNIFNGKDLTGWDTYLGPPHDSTGKKLSTTPIGLNHDPARVFSVTTEDGENVIRISGKETGGIISKKEFANYHLQIQFKWGKWKQPARRKKDSGLLYHSVGKLGADFDSWMRSQEFQVEEGNCGDYWGCAGGMADIPAIKNSDSTYVYSPGGSLFTFSADNPVGRHCQKSGDAENPPGQWNTLDLYCHGDTSMHLVNGKLMMVLYHNSQKETPHTLPLTKGKIQLQSEGAEVFYKNIRVRPITKLPNL